MKFARETVTSEMLMALCRNLTADISDEQLTKPAGSGQHSGTWILGHLSRVNDRILTKLGQKTVCPDAWCAFDPGSAPDACPTPPPSKASLLEMLDTSRRRLLEAMEQTPADQLAGPHGIGFFKDAPMKTLGEFLAFVATAHFAIHLGQLSMFRRQLGKPPLF